MGSLHVQVETIGDAYIVAANMLDPEPDHAALTVRCEYKCDHSVGMLGLTSGSWGADSPICPMADYYGDNVPRSLLH